MKKLLFVFGLAVLLIVGSNNCYAATEDCQDFAVLFARGTDASLGYSNEYREIARAAIDYAHEKYASAVVYDLDYPATGFSSVVQLFGNYVSAGDSYEFGRSVRVGAEMFKDFFVERSASCPGQKWAFVGYSQGAMVVSRALMGLDSDKVSFVMLIGDPETYLPEGDGFFPRACRGGELSSWRTYAPNCRTFEGVFGGRKPYETTRYSGKYSLWCNREDYICGSSQNPFKNSGHTKYVDSNLIYYGFKYLARKNSVFKPAPYLRSSPEEELDLSEIYDDGLPRATQSASGVEVENDDGVIRLKWAAPSEAKYLMIRLDGFDLGYVDASLGEFEIRDIDPGFRNEVFTAWMAEDGELKEFAVVDESTEGQDVVLGLTPESVVVGSGNAVDVSPAMPPEIAVTLPRNDETVKDDSNTPTLSPRVMNKTNGLSFASRASIVNIIFGIFGAGGLLIALFLRKRRGG